MESVKVYRAYYFDKNGNKKYINDGKVYYKIAHCKSGARCHYYQWTDVGKTGTVYIEECDLTVAREPQIGICDRTSRWDYKIEWKEN